MLTEWGHNTKDTKCYHHRWQCWSWQQPPPLPPQHWFKDFFTICFDKKKKKRQSLYLSIYPSGVLYSFILFFSLIYTHFFVIQIWCLVILFEFISPWNKSRERCHVTRQDFIILNLTLCKRGPSDSRPAKANRQLKIEQITLAFHRFLHLCQLLIRPPATSHPPVPIPTPTFTQPHTVSACRHKSRDLGRPSTVRFFFKNHFIVYIYIYFWCSFVNLYFSCYNICGT